MPVTALKTTWWFGNDRISVAPGRPELLLRDISEVTRRYRSKRPQFVNETTRCLAAIHEVSSSVENIDWSQPARKHRVRPTTLGLGRVSRASHHGRHGSV